jgi:hypothetical protein
MNPTHIMSGDELAAVGRVLYGERWQTPLARDLCIADRTLRRWLVGELPIPDAIESELRAILISRVAEIGGMIGFSVNPLDQTVYHYPSGAVFRYDDASTLTPLYAGRVTPEDAALIAQGAAEALRQKHERDPRLSGQFIRNV